MHYLASCSIVKNEYPYIFEFIRIHRALGVEHFLFFDRSDDPLQNHLKNEKDITVVHFPEPNRHAAAWAEGTKLLMDKARWVQFIDIDQVLFPTKTNDIKVLLQEYEKCKIVGFNWHTFGSNALEEEPKDSSTYEVYTKRAHGNNLPKNSINDHIQTVANPKAIHPVAWPDPHHPIYKKPHVQYNEQKKIIPFNSPFNRPASQDNAFIAHYYTRSRQYFQHKLNKMRADTGTSGGTMSDFDHHQTYLNEVEDNRIKEYWEKYCK